MTYFITPEFSVALNTKVGSSSLALAILKSHYPAIWKQIESAQYPPGLGPDDIRWHTRCPRELEPSKPVLLPVRDPVERFLSACAQVNINDDNLDAALDSLESGEPMVGRVGRRALQSIQENEHFTFQYLLQWGETHLYLFPDHIDALGEKAGLATPLPSINESALRPKPKLLAAQRLRVEDYYAKDIELYNFVSTASVGVVLDVDRESLKPSPKEPVPAWVYPLQLRLWLIRHGVSMEAVAMAIKSIPNPQTRDEVSVKWEFALQMQRADSGIVSLGSALGFSPSQIDQAFREAAQISG